MPKIVVNRGYGGFGLSHEAHMLYAKKKGIKLYAYIHDFQDNVIEYDGKTSVNYLSYFTEPITDGKFNDKTFFATPKRDDPALVEVVKELGDKANDDYAKLEIVEIPDDVKWTISEYDGYETVEEVHRKW